MDKHRKVYTRVTYPPLSYHSADPQKEKVLVFKGVSSSITLEEFKELLDFNKITHDEAERMK